MTMAYESISAGQVGGMTSNYPEAVKQSPFDRLSETVEWMREIQKRVNLLADRIAGQVPKDANVNKIGEIAGGGLIDSLERQTGFARAILDDIGSNLNRIENRL
jgi:hypothetical protein